MWVERISYLKREKTAVHRQIEMCFVASEAFFHFLPGWLAAWIDGWIYKCCYKLVLQEADSEMEVSMKCVYWERVLGSIPGEDKQTGGMPGWAEGEAEL